jgi:hypothetical protein
MRHCIVLAELQIPYLFIVPYFELNGKANRDVHCTSLAKCDPSLALPLARVALRHR